MGLKNRIEKAIQEYKLYAATFVTNNTYNTLVDLNIKNEKRLNVTNELEPVHEEENRNDSEKSDKPQTDVYSKWESYLDSLTEKYQMQEMHPVDLNSETHLKELPETHLKEVSLETEPKSPEIELKPPKNEFKTESLPAIEYNSVSCFSISFKGFVLEELIACF